jgi:hypothetical protein
MRQIRLAEARSAKAGGHDVDCATCWRANTQLYQPRQLKPLNYTL